jgi:hypothetical protein
VLSCRHEPPAFDATTTLNNHHLGDAGLADRAPDAVAAVRQAVRTMPGAGWIDVEAYPYPPDMPGWVFVCIREDTA